MRLHPTHKFILVPVQPDPDHAVSRSERKTQAAICALFLEQRARRVDASETAHQMISLRDGRLMAK